MRKLLLFALFALAQIQHAEVSGASLSMLVSLADGASSSFSVPYETSFGGSHYYMIAFQNNNSAYAKLWQDGDRTAGQFVSGTPEALKLVMKNLEDRNANASVASLSKSAALRLEGLPANFTSSQKECRRIMGLGKRECTSYATCLKACNSVPSFCMEVASHLGGKFILALWQYENDTRDFFDLAKNERSAASMASAYPTEENLKDYALALEELDDLGARLTKNSLLVREMYCAPPFSPGIVGASRVEVARARDLLLEISKADETAEAFAESGLRLNGIAPLPFDLTPKIQENQGNPPGGGLAGNRTHAQQTSYLDFDFALYAPFAAGIIIAAISLAFLFLKKSGK